MYVRISVFPTARYAKLQIYDQVFRTQISLQIFAFSNYLRKIPREKS